jgi:hypothetical protein
VSINIGSAWNASPGCGRDRPEPSSPPRRCFFCAAVDALGRRGGVQAGPRPADGELVQECSHVEASRQLALARPNTRSASLKDFPRAGRQMHWTPPVTPELSPLGTHRPGPPDYVTTRPEPPSVDVAQSALDVGARYLEPAVGEVAHSRMAPRPASRRVRCRGTRPPGLGPRPTAQRCRLGQRRVGRQPGRSAGRRRSQPTRARSQVAGSEVGLPLRCTRLMREPGGAIPPDPRKPPCPRPAPTASWS